MDDNSCDCTPCPCHPCPDPAIVPASKESDEPAEPTESEEPAESIKSDESAQPVEPSESDQPAQPAEPDPKECVEKYCTCSPCHSEPHIDRARELPAKTFTDECANEITPCLCVNCSCDYCKQKDKRTDEIRYGKKCKCKGTCLCNPCIIKELEANKDLCQCLVCHCDPCLSDPNRKKGSKVPDEPCLCEICDCTPCYKKKSEEPDTDAVPEEDQEESGSFKCTCDGTNCPCDFCDDPILEKMCIFDPNAVELISVVSNVASKAEEGETEEEEEKEDTEEELESEEEIDVRSEDICQCRICYCEVCKDPRRKPGSPTRRPDCNCPPCDCPPKCPRIKGAGKEEKDPEKEKDPPKKTKNINCKCPVCICEDCDDTTIERHEGNIKVSNCDCPVCLCDDCE